MLYVTSFSLSDMAMCECVGVTVYLNAIYWTKNALSPILRFLFLVLLLTISYQKFSWWSKCPKPFSTYTNADENYRRRWPMDCPHKERFMWSFDVFLGVRMNKLSNKQSSCRWYETPWRLCVKCLHGISSRYQPTLAHAVVAPAACHSKQTVIRTSFHWTTCLLQENIFIPWKTLHRLRRDLVYSDKASQN